MHPSGEATQNLLEMVRTPLRAAVRRVLRQAASEMRAVTIEQGQPGEGGGSTRITAEPLRSGRAAEYFRVSFEHPSGVAPVAATVHSRLWEGGDNALEEEARALRRELQATVESFEATNEELKGANEEVVSINEELQSTNEEL